MTEKSTPGYKDVIELDETVSSVTVIIHKKKKLWHQVESIKYGWTKGGYPARITYEDLGVE